MKEDMPRASENHEDVKSAKAMAEREAWVDEAGVISAALEKLKESTLGLPEKEAAARMKDYEQELKNIYADKSREEMINQSAYPAEALYRYFLSVSGTPERAAKKETPRERTERQTLRDVDHNLREKAVAEGKNFRGLPQKLESHKELYRSSKDMAESTENPPEALQRYHEYLKESGKLRDVKKTKDRTMLSAERQETVSGLIDKVLDRELGLMRRSAEPREEKKGFFGKIASGVKSLFGKKEDDFGARVIKRREELRREIFSAYDSSPEEISNSKDPVAELERIWKARQSKAEEAE